MLNRGNLMEREYLFNKISEKAESMKFFYKGGTNDRYFEGALFFSKDLKICDYAWWHPHVSERTRIRGKYLGCNKPIDDLSIITDNIERVYYILISCVHHTFDNKDIEGLLHELQKEEEYIKENYHNKRQDRVDVLRKMVEYLKENNNNKIYYTFHSNYVNKDYINMMLDDIEYTKGIL